MSNHLLFIFLFLFSFSAGAQDTLTLENAIEQGLKNNYSIIIARNAAQIAKTNNWIGNAGYLPSANLNLNDVNNITNSQATFVNATDTSVNRREIQRTGVKSSNLSANALITWTIFNGFNAYINLQRLQELQKAGESQARMNVENTVDQIIVTYYAIAQQQKMVSVIQDAINLSLQRLKLAETMRSIGSGSEQAVLQATVDVYADSARLVQQNANIRNSKADLNRYLSRDPATAFEVNNNIQLNPTLSFSDLQEKLDSQNSQLLVSKANVNVARYNIGNIRTQYAPLINLFGGYTYGRTITPVSNIIASKSNGLTYGVTASWNIFNGGVTTRNIQNSKILLQSGQLAYEDTKLLLHSDLFKYYNSYTTSLQLIKIQEKNVGTSRQDVEISMGRYRLGNISDIDLRVTQQKLIDAENNLLIAQYTAKQAEIELQRLSGQLLDVLK
jgi:outer membrane protein TolC